MSTCLRTIQVSALTDGGEGGVIEVRFGRAWGLTLTVQQHGGDLALLGIGFEEAAKLILALAEGVCFHQSLPDSPLHKSDNPDPASVTKHPFDAGGDRG